MNKTERSFLVFFIHYPITEIRVVVLLGGILLPKKGVNLPDSKLSMTSLTEKDLADLEFIIEQNLDWVALSFVRKAIDIIELKKIIFDKKSKTNAN